MARLGDVCTVVSGSTPKSNIPEYWDGSLNWITPAELTEDIIVINESQRKITEAGARSAGLSAFPAGTVILSSRAPIGKTAIAGVEMYCNQGFKNLICSDAIYNKYLFWFLRGKTDYLNSLGRGATFKEISKSIVENIEVPLPPLETQRHIAAVLDKVSDLIALRKQQLAKLDELVKARFVEMFGDCAEAVSAGVIMSEMRNGVSPSTSGKCPEKVLTLSAITQGRFDPSMWKSGFFDNPPPAEKRIHASDFYMCRGNGNKSLVGAGVYSKEDREDLVFPDTVIAARVDIARVCLPYLFIAWMQPSVRGQIEAGARTTNGTYKINQQIVSKIKVPLPPLNAQERFASFAAQIDKSKAVIQCSLEKLKTLKSALMQEYFGEVIFMGFPQEVAEKALVACSRCCCICHRFCGTKIELHHIKQKSYGGLDTFENCIPLCFDCHADMGKADPKHPKGKRYTEDELIAHRDSWYQKNSNSKGVFPQEVSQSDRELFKKICSKFSGDIQVWLRDRDLRDIHPTNIFYPLDNLLHEAEDPFFEFLNPEIEERRATLLEAIMHFVIYNAKYTFPLDGELSEYSAPNMWLLNHEYGHIDENMSYQQLYDEKHEQFEEEGNLLNESATAVWKSYCEFVQVSRRILNE